MAPRYKYFLLLLCAGLLSACSSIKPYYSEPSRDGLFISLPGDDPLHAVYLTGEFDGGDSLSRFQEEFYATLANDPHEKTLVFLGNVIPSPELEMEQSVQKIRRYANRMRSELGDVEAQTYWIPGNREWRNDQRFGYDHVKAVEAILEAYFGQNVFLPNNGCGEPVRIELTDGLQLILLDSEWWLHSKQNENLVLNDCELLNQEEILANLEGYLARHKSDQVIIATHHPIYDNGVKGGNYPARDHLFPFTRLHKKLMIPVPFAGSLLPGVSKAIGARQQFSHPLNQAYRRSLINVFSNYDGLVVASAHEQNLQYFEEGGNHFLISGGGTEAAYVRRKNKATFTYQRTGYSKILYYADGSVWMEQYGWFEDGFRTVYRKQIRAKQTEKALFDIQVDPEDAPSFIDTMASDAYNADGGWKFFFGEHFREEWRTSVRFPTVFLDTLKGGLTPIRQGGGFQTKALRLVDKDGRQYVLRSINKDASKVVPSFLRGTFADVVAQDAISASHPYSALPVAELAELAGVYHTNPELMFIPHQEALAEFNETFGNRLYLFEERPAGNRRDVDSFGNAAKIVSTNKVLQKTGESFRHQVDQKAVLRARLFDILIGDWDRHDDQWRWAEFKVGKTHIYQPIPRDRDQAFFRFNGFIPYLASRPAVSPMLRTFNYKIDNIPGLVFNARFFDRSFLNEMDRVDFQRIALELQRMDTTAIKKAFEVWPDTIQEINAEDISKKLINRLRNLVKYADVFYHYLAKAVDVPGTEKRDLFIVERLPKGKTRVQVFSLKHQEDGPYYERLFRKKETNEIRLFGKSGKDEFHLIGKQKRGIFIRIIGGKGDDLVIDSSRVRGLKKMTYVYDTPEGMDLENTYGESRKRYSQSPRIHVYNRLEHQYNKTKQGLGFGFNPDDGFSVGLTINNVNHGFRREPYRSSHSASGLFAFATRAVQLKYSGHFTKAIGQWSFYQQVEGVFPNYLQNYFGLGNEFDVPDERIDFFRVRGSQLRVFSSLSPPWQLNQTLKIGPYFELTEIDRTVGRIVDSQNSGLSPNTFDIQKYLGGRVEYLGEEVDNLIQPSRGYRIEASAMYLFDLSSNSRGSGSVEASATLYVPLLGYRKLILATQIGWGYSFGAFQFYQAQSLGLPNSLRGYRRNRFAGSAKVYQSTDLRFPVLKARNKLTVGLIGTFDTGRIWLEGENTRTWRFTYGGGFYIAPLNLAVLRLYYNRRPDGGTFSFGAKFPF